MNKFTHTKSKSDTDFHNNKTINDDISGSLKFFQNNINKEFKGCKKNQNGNKENKGYMSARQYSFFKKRNTDSQFIFILEKILIFKKQIDAFFFREKLPSIKFDLDNMLTIINKKLDDLKNNLIKECPILCKSVLIEKLNEFSEVIKSLIETKPQEFYKEVKFVILTQFENIRLEIFELLENLHENEDNENNENNNLHDINKIKNDCKFNHGILFNFMFDNDDDNENSNENKNNCLNLTSEIKDNIVSVIIPRKKKILEFIEDITHDILFSLTKFSYIIDYYSLTISNLNLHLFKSIISYVEKNIQNFSGKEDKTLFLIELIFILNRSFTKKSLIDIKKKVNSSESSIQNSMGKFILNNINELIPKCQGLDNDKLLGLKRQSCKSLFIKSYEKILFYKNYLKSFETTKKIELTKSFKFYYDLKLIFWKSVYTKTVSNVKSPDICCRICEQNIPLNDFVLHVYYCKEQNHYYKKMNNFKSKFKKYISSLEIYKTKINQKVLNQENYFFKKNNEMNKIFKKIKKEQELLGIDKNNSNNFLHTLIKIYINENNKTNDYYEKNPEKLSNISTLIYLTYFVYILNKKKASNKIDNEDNELSEILGNILSILLQILFNTEYLLEARHSKTKSNRYLNNIHFSFLNSSNDSGLGESGRYHSSKNVVFNEFSINNIEEQKKRKISRRQTFSNMMEDIKNKFSINKALLNSSSPNQNQNQSNISQISNTKNMSLFMSQNKSIDDSSLSIHSSNSNIFRFEDNNRRNSKTKTIKEINHFFELRSNSENKAEGIFSFCIKNPKKISDFHNKIISENKPKAINNFNISSKNKSYFKDRHKETKSSKFLFQKPYDFDKGPIKIESKNNIFNFDRKDSSIDGENLENSISISKEFFQDKKISNIDSLSGSYINSENDKDKNDKNDQNDNNIIDINVNHCFSAKTNNVLKIQNEKKLPSTFLKSDKMLLKYNPSLTFKETNKKSLFRVQHYEKKKTTITKERKSIKHKSQRFEIEEKAENGDIENNKDTSLNQFEKIKIVEKKRGNSPDVNKKRVNKQISITDKNLVLIDNCESSENESDDSYNDKINNDKKDDNVQRNLELKLMPKNKEISENSDDSSYEIGEKKEINGNKNIHFSDDSVSQTSENVDEGQAWLNFDSNFFMNLDINVQNPNVVNTIKELFGEINHNNNEDEENDIDKEDNNDENNDLKNVKINGNCFVSKGSESNIQFSNFKLVLPLAKGGYGTVGLYKKPKTGDMYAIKSVDITKMKEKKLSKTLQNERNILKGISSDFVVNSYYIFKDSKNYYFVMEYLPGGDVYNLLSSIILPFSTIQLIVAETLLAVYYLHSINIIHHDIKPENILITKDGHFKLSDFGLSKTINEEKKEEEDKEQLSYNSKSSSISSNSSINSENQKDDNKIEGTLYYMAPELFTNDYPIGKSIDYWAIGIVIYELFTFKIPFEGETQEITRRNIIEYNINWEPIKSEEVAKNYKNYIDCAIDLIKKFIFYNPEQRWGDKNFKEIQNHEFFKGFDWVNIKKIKNTAVLSHLKKVVEKNNKKIKELNKTKGDNNNGDLICEVDLAYDESDMKFSQRIDNLQKRNNELIKMKFKKKEIQIEDNDKNFKNSLLFDLQ